MAGWPIQSKMIRQRRSSKGKFKIFHGGPSNQGVVQTLNRSAIHAFTAHQNKLIREHRNEERQRLLSQIQDIPESNNAQDQDNDTWIDIDSVIDGQTPINLSHAGGEFRELLEEELWPQKKRRDYRTRRDAIIRRNLGFSTQLNTMVVAYLRWSEACGVSGQKLAAPLSQGMVVQEAQVIRVVDLFGECHTYSYDNVDV